MTHQIDRWQLVCLVFLCRVFAVLTFSPQNDPTGEGAVSMLTALMAAPVILLCGWCIQLLLDRAPGCGLLEAAELVSPLWGRIVGITVAVVCMLVALNSASMFYYFLDIVVYPNLSIQPFGIIFSVCCVYGAFLGLEALARFSLPVTVGLVITMALLIPLLWGDIRMVYLHSPFEYGWAALFPKAFLASAGNLELLIIACLAPTTRCRPLQIVGPVLTLNVIYVQLVLFLSTTTLGAFGYSQSFPIYAMMAAAETALMQRMDVLYIAAWILMAFLKCSLYLYVAQRAMKNIFKRQVPGRSLGLGVLLSLGCLVITRRIKWLTSLFNLVQTGGPFLVAVVGLPLITLGLLTLKQRKEKVTHETV